MLKIKVFIIIILGLFVEQLQAQEGYTYIIEDNGAYTYTISAVPNTSTSNFSTSVQSYGFTIIVPDGVTLTVNSSLGNTEISTFIDGIAVSMPSIDGYLITENLGTAVALPAPSLATNTPIATFQVNGAPTSGSMYILSNDSPLATTISALKSFMQADMVDDGMTAFTNAIDPNASGLTTPFSVTFLGSISYDSAAYCIDAPNPIPTITGGSGGTFSSGAGLSINTTTGEIDVSTSTPGNYTVTYSTGSVPTTSVTINALDDASFSYSAATFDTNASDPAPTISGVLGGSFSSTSGLSINSGTGIIDVSASTIGSYIITYTTTGTCPNSSTFSLTINSSTITPDFSPIIFTGNTTVIGASGIVDFRVLIGEFLNENSNGITSVELRIPKNSQLSISYNSTLTTMNGSPVVNSDWVYDGSHPILHKWTYISNGGIFTANTGKFLGINAIYSSPENSAGSFPLKTTVRYFSGGETNTVNNDDLDYIQFNNNN